MHIHGVNYNSMFKETVQNFLSNEVLLNELTKSYTDFEAYKLGIIDAEGNKIKAPITEAEKAAFDPLTKTIFRLKKFLGSKLDLLEASIMLEKQTVPHSTGDIEKYKKIVECREKIQGVVDELFSVIEESSKNGLSLEEILVALRA